MSIPLFAAAVERGLNNLETSQPSARARNKIGQLQQIIQNLKADISKSMLINEALWELMSEKLNITEQQLHKKIYEIDMRDGKLDGKNQKKAVQCHHCHHKISSRHAACIYCGTVMDRSTFSTS